jgi:hypothetical protein
MPALLVTWPWTLLAQIDGLGTSEVSRSVGVSRPTLV